jgi:hypothetical protein
MQLALISSEVVETILLSNSPYFTCILLIELARKKEVIGLHIYGVNVKVIAYVLSHRYVTSLHTCYIFIRLIR